MKKALFCIFMLIISSNLSFSKEKITSIDQLPSYTYTIPGKPSELVFLEEPFTILAEEVQKNINEVLKNYEIEDKTTLKRLYSSLISINLRKRGL